MDGFFKRVGGWFAAAITTVLLGVIFQTQNVLARLNGVGADVSLTDRLFMTGYDIFWFGQKYFIFVGIALAIAFGASRLVYKIAKFGRTFIFIVAGAAAIYVMLYAMKNVFFDIPLVAGARDGFGVGLQMLAGASGGFIYAKINRLEEKDLNA